jgi:outer membrane protein
MPDFKTNTHLAVTPIIAILLGTATLLAASTNVPLESMSWPGDRPWEKPVPKNPVLLTLSKVITAAFVSAPDIDAAQARVQAAQSALGVERSAFWPSLNVNASWGQSRTHMGGRSPDAYEAGIGASWELFNGFQREFEVLRAKHERDIAAHAATDAQRLLQRAVTRTFFAALLAQDRMLAARSDYAFNSMMLTLVSKRYATGTARRSEVLNFKIRIAEDVDSYLTERQLFAVNLTTLEALIGTADDFSVDTHRVVNPHPRPLESMVVNLEQEIAFARHARADLQAHEIGIAAAKASINAARGARLPSISLTADYTAARENDAEFRIPDETTSFVGLTLDWDVFAGGNTHHMVGAGKAQLREAEATYERALRELRREIKQNEQTLEFARMRVAAGILACEAAMEDRDMVTQLYESGLVAVTRLNEVQKDVEHSLKRLVQARVLFSQTWEELRIASGRMRPEACDSNRDPERVDYGADTYIAPGDTGPIPLLTPTREAE